MKTLVAWKEEPVMEATVENVELEDVRTDRGSEQHLEHPEEGETGTDEETDAVSVKRQSKKELDREGGRRGNERKPSKKVTYHDVPGAPDSTPRYAYRPGVARGSYRPTGVQGYVNPEKEEKVAKPKNKQNGSRPKGLKSVVAEEKRKENGNPRRMTGNEELAEHQQKMSRLEASLHELYPASEIKAVGRSEEEPLTPFKRWSNNDIPLEKMEKDGVSQLSESELLAIIMGNGPKEFPTVELMNQVLDDCGNDLSKLARKTVEDLMCYRGIGKNRAIAIVTACEFGKRFRKTAPEEKPVLKDALAVGDYMVPQLEDLDVEEFWALFFNPKQELLRRVRICRGEVSENAADPRNIMRFGVLYNASYIVTVHNHISGNPSPTKFDNAITTRLAKAAEAVRMKMRDHIILGDGSYFSFAENKKL